jgi:hypothetical protein
VALHHTLDKEFHRIKPCAAGATSPNKLDKGWRLRLSYTDGNAELAEEQVLPERVMRPDAQRILATLGTVQLTTDEVAWLRDALAELWVVMDRQDSIDQAKIDARRAKASSATKEQP